MGALGYADDGTILTLTVSSVRAMLRICEEFGDEYGVTYNGKKTVCLCFSGRRHIDPPSVTLNDVQLVWKSSAKHLGNIITTDLCDDEDIRFKKRDFVAKANSVVCYFKLTNRGVCSRRFVAIYMVAKHGVSKQKRCLSLMSDGVKKSTNSGACLTLQGQGFCQGLSGQPHCVTRSCVNLHFFYNGLSQGKNNNMKLISNISSYSDHRRKGTIGENVECINQLRKCSYDYLCKNTASTVDVEISDRVRAMKELNSMQRQWWSLANIWFTRTVWLGKLHVIRYCWTVISNMDIVWRTTEYLPSSLCVLSLYDACVLYFLHILHLQCVPFHYCTTSTK